MIYQCANGYLSKFLLVIKVFLFDGQVKICLCYRTTLWPVCTQKLSKNDDFFSFLGLNFIGKFIFDLHVFNLSYLPVFVI